MGTMSAFHPLYLSNKSLKDLIPIWKQVQILIPDPRTCKKLGVVPRPWTGALDWSNLISHSCLDNWVSILHAELRLSTRHATSEDMDDEEPSTSGRQSSTINSVPAQKVQRWQTLIFNTSHRFFKLTTSQANSLVVLWLVLVLNAGCIFGCSI